MSLNVLPPGIHHDPQRAIWLLVTNRSSYALGVSPEQLVLNLYWGARLATLDDLPAATLPRSRGSQEPALSSANEEYPPFGGLRYGELAAYVTFADGTRDLDLRFVSAQIAEQQGLPRLSLVLRDAFYPLEVTLHYRLDVENDLLIRSAHFSNTGTEPIQLERAFSAAWHLPRQFAQRTLTTLAGRWISEDHIQQRPLTPGVQLLESRSGVTGAAHAPYFAVQSAEEVYFGTLAWSGNWVIRIGTDITGATSIVGGIHEHDFSWRLSGGTTFETPDFVAGFSQEGLNGARQRLHTYTLAHVLPRTQIEQPRPVLYNSWEATLFDVDEPGQRALAERAASLGVELFVMDDGWFHGRIIDNAGLGDWFHDVKKFPNGLNPLIASVHQLGMKFGIWVEPEMVNPDSELYRAHPDWVYHFPNRARSESRQQLVLNLARADVRDYLYTMLNTLLSDHEIDFIKWDMNRPVSEPGWPATLAEGNEARELWVRHVYGLYELLDRLRAAHPQLSIESCSSGGFRADLGIFKRTDQAWTSDNSNPEARLFIQEGFSLLFPARVMVAWITDNRSRNTIPLSFSSHVAMLGNLGIGGNLLHWSDEDMAEVAHWTSVYKEVRHLVQGGIQTWLLSPHEYHGELAAVQYTAPDASEAIVFVFRRQNVFADRLPRLRLQNLNPEHGYKIDSYQYKAEPIVYERSGAALLRYGLELALANTPYDSTILHLRAQ